MDCDFLLNSNAVFSRKPSQPKFCSLLSQPFNCNTQSEVCSLWERKRLGAPPIPQNRLCALSSPAPPLPLPRGGSPLRAAPAAAPRQASTDPGPGRGPLLSPPPGAALRPPSAEPDVTVTGGRRGRCAPLAVQSPSGQVELGPANGAWKVRKDPALSPDPLPRRGPQRIHRPGAFSRFFSACCKEIAGSGKEIECRLAIKRETNGAFCLLSV